MNLDRPHPIAALVAAFVALWATALLLPRAATAAEPVERTGIPFASAGGGALRLDITHEPGTAGRPVLVLLHGGGWRVGDRRQWSRNGWTEPWVRAGFVVVAPSYRLACGPEDAARMQLDVRLCGGSMGDARSDVLSAVRWTTRNVRRYGGDPSRIVLVGASAGAQLALLAGADRRLGANVRGVAAFSPPADLPAIGRSAGWLDGALAASIRCAWRDCPERWVAHSPHAALARAPRARMRPTYLFASRRDGRVPFDGAASLAAMLRGRGVPVALHEPAVRMASCHGPWACERFAVAGTQRALKTDLLLWLRRVALAPSPSE